MLIPNHPNDERLSALASRETDATADATLTNATAANPITTDRRLNHAKSLLRLRKLRMASTAPAPSRSMLENSNV